MNETFSVTPGGFVDSYQPHGFSYVYGIWVDNFSGGWLQINQGGLWVPPYTRGWKATIFPGTTTVTVRSYDFANGARITGATGQSAQVTIWDAPNGDSEGIDFFDQQVVPIRTTILDTPDDLIATLVAAPAVGRIRVYEISLLYGFNPASDADYSSSVMLRVYPFAASANDLVELEVSPATPRDSQFLSAPGGDCPIGTSLLYDLIGAEKTGLQTMR